MKSDRSAYGAAAVVALGAALRLGRRSLVVGIIGLCSCMCFVGAIAATKTSPGCTSSFPDWSNAPASASQPQCASGEARVGAKACHANPAAIRPTTNAARQERPPGGWANKPCRIPLTPAMRPLAASSHTLARPISTPPARADTGVKLSK